MIFPRILRSSRLTFMLALLMTAAVALSAQSAQDTGTDLKFHKFQPKVPPEQAAKTAAAQLPGPAGMSVGAAQQIQSLEQEKDSRTPAQQKIDSNVLYTIRMLQGKPAAPGIPYLYTGVDLDENNNLVVDITAYITDQLLQQLKSAGAEVLYSNAELRSIRAIVPPGQIEGIAASPDVIFIWPKQEAITNRVERPLHSDVLPHWNVLPGFEQRVTNVRNQLAALLPKIAMPNGGATTNSAGTPIT